MSNRFLCALFILLVSSAVMPQSVFAAETNSIAPSASMNERVLNVPGDADRPAVLKVTVLTPDGVGPFPLAIMNHGASGTNRLDLEPRYLYSFSSYYFLSRGYAVVLPMMRGFSGSEGRQLVKDCNQEELGLNNARDIQAVVNFMLIQPYIDGTRVIVAGQSFGGWNTLAFGAMNHPRVKGLINFVGGMNISSCNSNATTLAHAAEHYGSQTTIPSIWFYGDNDSKFAPDIWHAMFDRYTAAGGKAELVAYGRFMNDSHNLLGFPEGLRIWSPKVDAFLSKIGLPSKIVHPEYLPANFPPPTNFAKVDDIDAIPYITDEGREKYRKFLSASMPRVFVLSPSGAAGSFDGGFDPVGRALSVCQQHAQKCQVYAADDYVSWKRPTPAPAPTNFASIKDATALPYQKENSRQGYEKYLTLRKPKAFAIAPDGAWSFSSLGEDPLVGAIALCSQAHQGCQLYAVDDSVVWPVGQHQTANLPMIEGTR
jgi:dienelactone hydrolase